MTSSAVEVRREAFGTKANGEPVERYTLANETLSVSVITYGARVTAVKTADRSGAVENIVLGYADLGGYEADKSYFGALVGRFANRLAKGRFTLDGKPFAIPVNNGENSLHGGPQGFAQQVWRARALDNGVEMTLASPAGQMGYPGTLSARCTYTLQGSALRIDVYATTDAATVVNLTNHSYFNLSGEGNGTIEGAEVSIDADRYVPVDAGQIPTGELAPVKGTPFDFRTPHIVGDQIESPHEQIQGAGGYDHTFVLNGTPGTLRAVAQVRDPRSGRTLSAQTTQPGVQFYTGNFLTGKVTGSNGKTILRRGGFCLETQHFPDSPNQPAFPSTVLRPGETFHETTVYVFGVA